MRITAQVDLASAASDLPEAAGAPVVLLQVRFAAAAAGVVRPAEALPASSAWASVAPSQAAEEGAERGRESVPRWAAAAVAAREPPAAVAPAAWASSARAGG